MLRKILQHLCYSNVWIGLGAASLSLLYFYLKSIEPNWDFIAFVFCSTVLTYTYQRYQKLLDNEPIQGDRIDWMKKHPHTVKGFLILSFLGTAVFALFLSYAAIGLLVFLGLISFFYAFKLTSLKGSKSNLRDIPGLKIILIGMVWAGSSVLIIDLEFSEVNIYSAMSFIGISLFIIGITIPFDIRDLHVDEVSKKTLPQLIGYLPSVLIAVLLILLSAYFIHLGTNYNFWILLCVSGLISFIIIPSKPGKTELFFSFTIDGILILYPGLIYLLNSL